MQGRWVTRMARLAYTNYGADWVINSDADEFWWPCKKSTLKSTLKRVSKEYGVVAAPRYNFVPRPRLNTMFYNDLVFRERVSTNPLGKPLQPKVCHRGCPDVTVKQGNHKVEAGSLGEILKDESIVIFHFPLRTYEQFENKMKKGGKAYENNPELPSKVGRTWREMYKLYQMGQLRNYYEEQIIRDDKLDPCLSSDTLVVDRRLQNFLRRLPKPPGKKNYRNSFITFSTDF